MAVVNPREGPRHNHLSKKRPRQGFRQAVKSAAIPLFLFPFHLAKTYYI